MPKKPIHSTNNDQASPALPDQFLYARKGPGPQPSPSHPLLCADEVLNIPPIETLMFNATIGQRYLIARTAFPPAAAMYAVAVEKWAGPDDVRFNKIMFGSVYTRFLKPLVENEHKELIKHSSQCGNYGNMILLRWIRLILSIILIALRRSYTLVKTVMVLVSLSA